MPDHPLPARTTRTRAWGAVLALTLVATACGGDDDSASDDTATPITDVSVDPTVSSPGSTEPTTATTEPVSATSEPSATTEPTSATSEPTSSAPDDTTDAPDGSVAPVAAEAFCQSVIETQSVLTTGPEVDFETATEEEIASAMEEYSGQLLPRLDELAADVPEEIGEDVEALTGVLRDALDSGAEPFSDPTFVEADRNIDAFMLDNCGYEVVSVEAVDYRFEGAPATVAAGTVGFDFQNNGTEVHEMILFRINDDVDMTLEELLELPEEEAETMIQFIGAAFAASGEEDVIFADLEPGRHAMLCFIPTGTTSMEMLEGEEAPEGPPHFTQGMVHEFEVT